MASLRRLVSWIRCLFILTSLCSAESFHYSTVLGYFLQDDPNTNATTFDYTAVNFGLINQIYNHSTPTSTDHQTQWQLFTDELTHLNTHSPANTSYRVLFLARHGEGYHNTAESYYGTPAWNCYYSLLPGNNSVTWTDAHLTQKGIEQTLRVSSFWRHELAVEKVPPPQSYYTSPLYRCLQTANYTFSALDLPRDTPFVPTIKEFLREGISMHTCDHRSDRSLIHKSFPEYKFEPGFREQDELWTGSFSETPNGQDVRSHAALDDIFSTDDATWISVTSHSGEIASLLRVLGHRQFDLSIAAVIPVLVKVEVDGSEATATMTAGPTRTPSAHCAWPPLTSNSEKGCVCCKDVIVSPTKMVTQGL